MSSLRMIRQLTSQWEEMKIWATTNQQITKASSTVGQGCQLCSRQMRRACFQEPSCHGWHLFCLKANGPFPHQPGLTKPPLSSPEGGPGKLLIHPAQCSSPWLTYSCLHWQECKQWVLSRGAGVGSPPPESSPSSQWCTGRPEHCTALTAAPQTLHIFQENNNTQHQLPERSQGRQSFSPG